VIVTRGKEGVNRIRDGGGPSKTLSGAPVHSPEGGERRQKKVLARVDVAGDMIGFRERKNLKIKKKGMQFRKERKASKEAVAQKHRSRSQGHQNFSR